MSSLPIPSIRLHRTLGPLRVRIGEQLVHPGRHDLPGQAAAVLEPAGRRPRRLTNTKSSALVIRAVAVDDPVRRPPGRGAGPRGFDVTSWTPRHRRSSIAARRASTNSCGSWAAICPERTSSAGWPRRWWNSTGPTSRLTGRHAASIRRAAGRSPTSMTSPARFTFGPARPARRYGCAVPTTSAPLPGRPTAPCDRQPARATRGISNATRPVRRSSAQTGGPSSGRDRRIRGQRRSAARGPPAQIALYRKTR